MLWLALATAQAGLVAVLVWLWATGESDATALRIDWEFVGLTAATPLALGASSLIGWRIRRRAGAAEVRAIRGVAAVTQWTSLGLFVLALPLAATGIFGEIVFGPMG